jgi:hypothetical protein
MYNRLIINFASSHYLTKQVSLSRNLAFHSTLNLIVIVSESNMIFDSRNEVQNLIYRILKN